VFRGSGFYITDYGKDGKGPRKAESEKSAAEKTSESKSEAGTKEAKSKPEPSSSKQTPAKGGGKADKE
jgi:predicted nucleic acid-binding Zn ribbon protein